MLELNLSGGDLHIPCDLPDQAPADFSAYGAFFHASKSISVIQGYQDRSIYIYDTLLSNYKGRYVLCGMIELPGPSALRRGRRMEACEPDRLIVKRRHVMHQIIFNVVEQIREFRDVVSVGRGIIEVVAQFLPSKRQD